MRLPVCQKPNGNLKRSLFEVRSTERQELVAELRDGIASPLWRGVIEWLGRKEKALVLSLLEEEETAALHCIRGQLLMLKLISRLPEELIRETATG